MENADKDLSSRIERSLGILFSLVDYLDTRGIIPAGDFISFCAGQPKGMYHKEIFRNEEDARSVKDNLHPGGIRATLDLCEMAGIHRDMRVLDAGTGHGGAARVMAENYGCRVTGIDRDSVRLLDAIFRTRACRLEELVSFRLEDAYGTTFEDECFDVVFRQHSVYGGEEERFIQECRRVLKPGGIIAFHGILKRITLGGKKWKMEDYSLEEYIRLLNASGFSMRSTETEESTRFLLESLQEDNPAMCGMIHKKLITGIRLVAERGKQA